MGREARIKGALIPALAGTAAIAVACQAQTCGTWTAVGGLDSAPGIGGAVNAMAAFDEGAGTRLFVGGAFQIAAPGQAAIRNLARWDGQAWSAVGSWVPPSSVRAAAVYDGGAGPGLIVASFDSTAQADMRYVRRWNGASWSSVGGAPPTGGQDHLRVVDLGSGPALYASGSTLSISPASASVARWDGVAWALIGQQIGGGTVHAVEGFGAQLYAAHAETGLHRLNGGTWGPVSQVPFLRAYSLAVFDDGTGTRLYVGGADSGGNAVCGRFDGAVYEPLAIGPGNYVDSFEVLIEGVPRLHAGVTGASAPGSVRRWSGSSWDVVATIAPQEGFTSTGQVRLRAWPPGGDLVVGGSFGGADAVVSRGIVRRAGGVWTAFPPGVGPSVAGLAEWDDGTGSAIYVGGVFKSAAGVPLNNIARRAGATYEPLGAGATGMVTEMLPHDDGSGESLFVAGQSMSVTGAGAKGIAKWDGAQWFPLGSGLEFNGGVAGRVNALASFDAGGGPLLYVGGAFDRAGGATVNSLASWNGASWSSVGSPTVGPPFPTGDPVFDMAVHDAGGSAALYVAGTFTSIGGQSISAIARYNGAVWAAVGPPFGGPFGGASLRALSVVDPGGGPELSVFGAFSSIGGQPIRLFARWDGVQWSGVGSVSSTLYAVGFVDGPQDLTWVQAPGAPVMVACASASFQFTSGGSTYTQAVAWNGSAWSGSGLPVGVPVRALLAVNDPLDPRVLVGGDFVDVGGVVSPGIAEWHVCGPCYPDCNGRGGLTIADFGCFQTKFVAGDPYADCNGVGGLTIADFGCFQTKFVAGCP